VLLLLDRSSKSEGGIDIHESLEIAEGTLERARISKSVRNVSDEMT
jgi:hypothetical protein